VGISQSKIAVIFVLLVFIFAGATYEEITLDKKKQAEYIEKKIVENKGQISVISSRTALLRRQADSLETAINSINSFLKNFEKERYMTPEEIAAETNTVITLAEEVERIQRSFRQKVVNLYKHGKNYELELLLSSKTPNEYLKRNQYLQKFSQNRKKELQDIQSKKFLLEEKKKMLTLSTSSQRFYVESKRKDRVILEEKLKQLTAQKKQSESESSLIAAKLNRYESQLSNVRNFLNNFEQNRDKFSGSKNGRVNYDSGDITSAKGNLNLPVDIGLVKVPFGSVADNSTGNLSINNGIDLSIARGSKVYSIAEGTVSLTGELPYYGKVIIITHLNGFRSVYASLNEVNVRIGDFVNLNQVIGKSGENLEGQLFHFELWQNNTPLNPAEWLKF
jgi:murein hydrolase activator